MPCRTSVFFSVPRGVSLGTRHIRMACFNDAMITTSIMLINKLLYNMLDHCSKESWQTLRFVAAKFINTSGRQP